MEQAGLDATIPFHDIGHSSTAQELMKDYYIGDVMQEGAVISTNNQDENDNITEINSSEREGLLSNDRNEEKIRDGNKNESSTDDADIDDIKPTEKLLPKQQGGIA